MTATTSVLDPSAAADGAPLQESPGRRRNRWLAAIAALVVAAALGVGWQRSGSETGPGVDSPATAAFLNEFDEITTDLHVDRTQVADRSAAGSPGAGYDELAHAVDVAASRYRTLEPPAALAGPFDEYLAALDAEETAAHAVTDNMKAGEPTEASLRALLDRRTEADNLQRALRRTAAALASDRP